jgi:hypothetical protein
MRRNNPGVEPETEEAIALLGAPMRSRAEARPLAPLVKELVRTLDGYLGRSQLSPCGATNLYEIEALLRPGADPFAAIVFAHLTSGVETLPTRWVIARGPVDVAPGWMISPTYNATHRTGAVLTEAGLTLKSLIKANSRRRVVVFSGNPQADAAIAALMGETLRRIDRLGAPTRALLEAALLEGADITAISRRTGQPATAIGAALSVAGLEELRRSLAQARGLFAA